MPIRTKKLIAASVVVAAFYLLICGAVRSFGWHGWSTYLVSFAALAAVYFADDYLKRN